MLSCFQGTGNMSHSSVVDLPVWHNLCSHDFSTRILLCEKFKTLETRLQAPASWYLLRKTENSSQPSDKACCLLGAPEGLLHAVCLTQRTPDWGNSKPQDKEGCGLPQEQPCPLPIPSSSPCTHSTIWKPAEQVPCSHQQLRWDVAGGCYISWDNWKQPFTASTPEPSSWGKNLEMELLSY